jgi:hypothetical protein
VPCCFRGRALRLKTRRGYRPAAACYGFEEKAASLVLVGLSLPPRSIYPTRDFFAGASGRAHEQQQQCWFQTQTGARVVVRVRASGGPWTTQAGRHVRSGQQSASASGVCMARPVALHLPLPLPPGQDRTGLGSSLRTLGPLPMPDAQSQWQPALLTGHCCSAGSVSLRPSPLHTVTATRGTTVPFLYKGLLGFFLKNSFLSSIFLKKIFL